MSSITASDYLETDVCQELEDNKDSDIYTDSVFKNLKDLSSKKKGKYFEQLYAEYKLSQGVIVTKPENSDHDRIVDGLKVEIKGSFIWSNANSFRWQQIRTGQDYDVVVFIAIYPDRVEFYQADKETVKRNVEVQDAKGNWIHNQHGGKTVNSGCFFIDGLPSDFDWFKQENIGN